MENKRKHQRHPVTVDFKITHPDIGEKIVKTKNVSDSGLFILVDPSDMPPTGEIVQGQVQGQYGDLPIVSMIIVRGENNGLGLKFIET